MAGYKLYYFTRMGRAEYVRYIFAYAGVKYDDIRIEPGKQGEWAELKPSEIKLVFRKILIIVLNYFSLAHQVIHLHVKYQVNLRE